MIRLVAGIITALAMVAGCSRGTSSAATPAVFSSVSPNVSCSNPGPSVPPDGALNPPPAPAPGDAAPSAIADTSYSGDDTGFFSAPGVNATLVLRSHRPIAGAGSAGNVGMVYEVRIISTNGEIPFSASDFWVKTADGHWYSGVPARVLDPTVRASLSIGVLPANRMIDGFVAFDAPGTPTTIQFIDVASACNLSVIWHLGT
jgi:hypothetical protein